MTSRRGGRWIVELLRRLIERWIQAEALGCWLRLVGEGSAQRVRIGIDPTGDELFATSEEAERAAKEAERAAKEAALARIAELEAELRRRGE